MIDCGVTCTLLQLVQAQPLAPLVVTLALGLMPAAVSRLAGR